MTDAVQFSRAISEIDGLTEVDVAIAIAWFLSETSPRTPTLNDVVVFAATHGIRNNINRSRLQRRLIQERRVSAPKGKPISVVAAERRKLRESYSKYLAQPTIEIDELLLVNGDFENSREYIRELVRQINGSYQFCFYDACAVMMRRLAEVLIIDAYVVVGEDDKIRDGNGHLLMMNGLINALKSGNPFKLSRNAPTYLEALKTLGDNAAHSRNYITKKKDVDDYSQKFRMLIDEMVKLSNPTHPSSTPK